MSKFTLVDATTLGLSKRIKAATLEDNSPALLIQRKSRFIMKDTLQFLERATIVKEHTGTLPALLLDAPICSKSVKRLGEEGITIIEITE